MFNLLFGFFSVSSIGNNFKVKVYYRSMDFQNGHLIDKDVQYGFAPEQLKSWFHNLMGSKSRINIAI
ncbi:hypothetical protein [Clostridium sp. LCP25S3_F8]|uniref:hypothetical protein n=1 Tax=Clostridium sp. LCP25S3_F8 TaxID=3438751 RepID=UPI003F8FD145